MTGPFRQSGLLPFAAPAAPVAASASTVMAVGRPAFPPPAATAAASAAVDLTCSNVGPQASRPGHGEDVPHRSWIKASAPVLGVCKVWPLPS